MKTQNSTCRKKEYQKFSFDLKLSIIDQINNGQISANYASKKHGVEIYNNERLHWSLDLKTPQEVHLDYDKTNVQIL